MKFRLSFLVPFVAALGLTLGGISVDDASAETDKKTLRLWKSKCASCHGKDGKGATKQGKKMGVTDMTTPAWQKKFSDADIKKVVLEGFKRDKDGKAQEMKPMKGKLDDAKIAALIKHIRTLK